MVSNIITKRNILIFFFALPNFIHVAAQNISTIDFKFEKEDSIVFPFSNNSFLNTQI